MLTSLEETPRRSHEKKEKMKGREKSSDPENTNVNSSKNEDPNARKKSKKASSKLDSNKRVNPTDEIGQRDKRNNRGNASNQGGVQDMISKRKQQREAVAAILNTSLIPSHKPKPPKRPLSPGSTASSHTRPAKAIKESTRNNSKQR